MAFIRETSESMALFIREFFDSFSLSGAIIFMFSCFICVGLAMQWHGIAGGDKVWETFTTALTTFVVGKKTGEQEQIKKIENGEEKKL